jgi:hypothetical protein
MPNLAISVVVNVFFEGFIESAPFDGMSYTVPFTLSTKMRADNLSENEGEVPAKVPPSKR